MRTSNRSPLLLVGATACLMAACAGAAPEPSHTLMDKTKAGSERCRVTKSHDRPFVIEWDATDLASFEAKAQRDIVFVRYEGCQLTVLDCADGGAHGQLGAYHAPQWTSGSIEGIDMKTEDDVYAHLPLGAAALAGRVEAGEALRLRYFVSGVASATRDSTYRADLPKRCATATHYVESYNLGAFELDSSSQTKAGASVGVGGGSGASAPSVGGSQSKQSAVLKRGGDLESCKDEAGRATRKCQVPIRINLRAVEDGAAPKSAGAGSSAGAPAKSGAPPKDAMAALVEAGKFRNAAIKKLMDGDGPGCLRDLDRGAEIDPDPEHIEIVAQLHGQCVMASNKCEAGKAELRAYYRRLYGKQSTEEAVDTMVKSQAQQHCPKK